MLFCAATIAWMRALTWMPYGVRGLRVVLAVIALAAIDTQCSGADAHFP